MLAPVLELDAAQLLKMPAPLPCDVNDAVGSGERERPQDDGVDGAEDRAVRSDAKRQCEDDRDRKRSRPEQRSQRIQEVLSERVHAPLPSGQSLNVVLGV